MSARTLATSVLAKTRTLICSDSQSPCVMLRIAEAKHLFAPIVVALEAEDSGLVAAVARNANVPKFFPPTTRSAVVNQLRLLQGLLPRPRPRNLSLLRLLNLDVRIATHVEAHARATRNVLIFVVSVSA